MKVDLILLLVISAGLKYYLVISMKQSSVKNKLNNENEIFERF